VVNLRAFQRAALATLVTAVAVTGLGFGTQEALARTRIPHIASVRCWPPRACDSDPHVVAPGGKLRLKGRNLRRGMLVFFPGSRKAQARSLATTPRLRRVRGLVVTVPSWAKSGRIAVAARRGPRSKAAGPIRVGRAKAPTQSYATGAFDGNGMWIWYVSSSSGGDPAAIAAQARLHGVRTVFVKSSDGTTWWPQFSAALVAALKDQGIQVCAWQFVYGSHPAGEAALGARAASTGAACLVIDAESAYEGKYAQAESYLKALRSAVGSSYPLALSGFPYVDYHRSFPYSVFFGPDGVQANLPQIYWRAIGTSVDGAVAHTYTWNVLYQRPIFPLGQLYANPPPSEIQRFRQITAARGATGVSWWSWQSASGRGWTAIGSALDPLAGPPAPPDFPTLQRGARGDVVVWAQEHLISAGQSIKVDGVYAAALEQAVRSFQTYQGLLVTGQIDASTWSALLRYQPAAPVWSRVARASAASLTSRNGPRSAQLRDSRGELRGSRR
jgi:Putative peptidoglycan binding domain